MKRKITDYIYLFGFILYIFLGIIVSIIVLPFLIAAVLAKRLHLSAFSRFRKESWQMKSRKKRLEKEAKELEKILACHEKRVVELRKDKERLGAKTRRIEGEIMVIEETIEENYGRLNYCREEIKKVDSEIAQFKKDPEKFLESRRSADGNLTNQEI